MKQFQLQFCFFLILGFTKLFAQQAITSSGGNATGSGGSSGYSIGQIAYSYQTGSNGSVTQGVQQAFEIITLSGQEYNLIVLHVTTYPNPTTDNLTINIGDTDLQNGSYQLFDLQGKAIATAKITEKETTVVMQNLASATYFLSIFSNAKMIKTFKIFKN